MEPVEPPELPPSGPEAAAASPAESEVEKPKPPAKESPASTAVPGELDLLTMKAEKNKDFPTYFFKVPSTYSVHLPP